MKQVLYVALTLAVAAGCGGRYPAQQSTMPKPAADATPDKAMGGEAQAIDITKAGMPYKVLRAKGGREITEGEFFDELGQAHAVCLGESHPNPHHHWAQLHMLDRISKEKGQAAMALGLEMFQKPFQGVLDDFASGRINESDMLTRSGWEDRWGYDFALYRPMLLLAVERKLAILALNTANELRKKISKNGLESLSPAERKEVPELKLDDAEHRAWFDAIMGEVMAHRAATEGSGHEGEDKEESKGSKGKRGGHTKGEGGMPSPDRMDRTYMIQVLWDETMADTAVTWLKAAKDRKIVILAGSGHCHDSAIVRRIQRRGIERVVSVRPVVDIGDGQVASELAAPTTDYLFVMTPER